jgi:uncharacterized protein (DUF2267 family)
LFSLKSAVALIGQEAFWRLDLDQRGHMRRRQDFSTLRESIMGAGLEGIDRSVQLAHIWINDLDQRLGWNDKRRSYRLLRTVLQALRDWLPVNEAADIAAQLPELLRGAFYEHWRPGTTPVQSRSKTDFLTRIRHELAVEPPPDWRKPSRRFLRCWPPGFRAARSSRSGTLSRPISGPCGQRARLRSRWRPTDLFKQPKAALG